MKTIENTYIGRNVQLEPTLGDRLLHAFAVRRIAGGVAAYLALLDEAAHLVGGTARVLLVAAEAVVHIVRVLRGFRLGRDCVCNVWITRVQF